MSTEYFRLNNPVIQAERTGLSWQLQILIFLLTAAAIISRRTDAISHPQFFAEDGVYWYANAYNLGWFHALFIPRVGYFQTLPRLTAALSLLLPLRFAPLLMNLVAIVIQVLPVTLLLSSRMTAWGPLTVRALMAFTYIALPNSHELDAVITNAQWHLALLAALIVLATPSSQKLWRAFDAVAILLSGLTGPFCLALFPLAAFAWWKKRDRWRLVLAGLLGGCFIVQVLAFTTTGETRSAVTLGASPQLFFRMLVGDVYLGAITGQNHFALHGGTLALMIVGLLSSALIVYCFWKANLEMRLFLIYCFVLYAASLRNPLVSYDKPQWLVLEDAPGLRYWFFPMLAFAWSAAWCIAPTGSRPFRILAGAALVLMFSGIAKDWEYLPFSNHNFQLSAKVFDTLPPGHAMVFPLYPDGWSMQLIKHGKSCGALPEGFVDAPTDHAQVGKSLTLTGWVTAPEPIQQITIFVDTAVKATVEPNFARPDVDAKYPHSAIAKKGWQATVDLSNLPAGPHSVEVHAQLANGCESILGAPTVIEN